MNIREERPSDIEQIWEVNAEAFDTETEANLVNVLRKSCSTFISLVAERKNKVIGHISFSPVKLNHKNELKIIGLAPMAVTSQYQKQGIGSELIKSGLALCQAQGYDAVVVLGHPSYYPKFGFVPALKFSIKCEYEVPDEAFMIYEFVSGTLKGNEGVIKYHEAFNSV